MDVIIIDDESHARNVLATILVEECNSIETIYQAANLKDGVNCIKTNKPRLVFLDIEMPNESGLEILNYFKDTTVDFKIIFTTAYSKYAIDAFKTSAIDYLLKPIDSNELIAAINRAETKIEESQLKNQLQTLAQSFNKFSINKIALDLPRGTLFLSHDEIMYFEANDSYTKVYLVNGKTELICKTLKHFALQLQDNALFFKPHRSYLLNLKFMTQYVRKNGLYIIMEDQKTIPVSRERKKNFLEIIDSLF